MRKRVLTHSARRMPLRQASRGLRKSRQGRARHRLRGRLNLQVASAHRRCFFSAAMLSAADLLHVTGGEVKSPFVPRMRKSAARHWPQQGFSPHELVAGQFYPRPCVLLTFPPQGDAQFFPAAKGWSQQNLYRAGDNLRSSQAAVAICPAMVCRSHLFCARWCAAEFSPRARSCFSRHTRAMEVCSRASAGFMSNFKPRPKAFAGFSLAEPAAS